jgi:acrylyl-CoA reductase (NADPH)
MLPRRGLRAYQRLLRLQSQIRPLAASASDTSESFKALVVDAGKQGLISCDVKQVNSVGQLPRQDDEATATVRVRFSSLNYKDGMTVQGKPGVVTPPGKFPIVPGIDAAGEVVECSSGAFSPGDRVVVTGNKIGQHFDGGYAQRLRVKSEWLTTIPSAFSSEESMVIGTAGVTAMQCVMHLEEAGCLRPDKGEVLVTGAAGGVGSFAVAILAELGYEVVASSGRAEPLRGYFESLGARRVIGRLEPERRPLGQQLWAGVVDTVGGATLAAAVAQTKYRCGVASTGVAGAAEWSTTVYPFILRGVRLLGVDSTLPCRVEGWPNDPASEEEYREERRRIWTRLSTDLPKDKLRKVHGHTIALEELPQWAGKILSGEVQGRVVVDLDR